MTDEQILKFVMKENAEGTSQAQIVTKLMQKGVTIEQIRRVKDKYERQAKNKGLGTVSSKDSEEDNGRQRKNNGKKGSSKNDDDEESPQYRIKDTREKKKSKSKEVVYDETNEDWLMMQDELNTFIPDTTAMLEKLLAEKRKKKVFGRDIFNNKDLTFEPNMNIATPQNYILGPGDAVYIDIYGASQKL